jgi:hypothetical protein
MLTLILPLVQSLTCDLEVSSGICLYSGKSVLKPFSKSDYLTGYWSFDDSSSLDYSGYSNHGLSGVSSGGSYSGQGSSSRFSGSSFITIPNSSSLTSEVFSLSFWLYLEKEDTINQTGLKWCPILQKGSDDESSGVYQRSPAIFLNRENRSLQVFITTTETEFVEGESVLSNARLPYNRWTHVSVLRSTQKVKLYVNGILDSSNSTQGWTETNDSPLYVGNTPSKMQDCPVPMLIDELKFFNDEISESEVLSEASNAFGQYESRFVNFGCSECSLDVASESCSSGYHLCTTIELHSGGYSIIKAMGWDKLSEKVWSYSALSKKNQYQGEVGLGVCCLDLGY